MAFKVKKINEFFHLFSRERSCEKSRKTAALFTLICIRSEDLLVVFGAVFPESVTPKGSHTTKEETASSPLNLNDVNCSSIEKDNE